MINTILLALTGLITAITPIILAIMNSRQHAESVAKVARLEQMHTEVLSQIKRGTNG